MQLAPLITHYQDDLEQRYGEKLLPGHRRAMSAMLGCRTPHAARRPDPLGLPRL